MTAGVYRCRNAAGMFGNEIFAAFHKLFPLRAPAVDDLTAAIDIVAYLVLALIDQGAYLLLAFIDHSSDAFGRLSPTVAQILGAVARSFRDVFTGFASAFGRIQNAYQSAHAQSRQKPRHSVRSVFCHDPNSPFAGLGV